MVRKLLRAALMFVCFISAHAKLSDYTTICKVKDPALNKCVVDATQKIIKHLQKGIPEFGIQPIDPMVVPLFGIQNTEIGMSIVLLNSTHTGLSDIKITKARVDPEKYNFELHVQIPQYTIIGDYDVHGKLMLMPINGRGSSNITLYDINAVWNLRGEEVVKKNVKYMKLNEFKITISPRLMRSYFSDLFRGNKLMSDSMNGLLNTQWKEVYRQIKLPLEKSYSDLSFKLAKKIFDQTPYSSIFADL